MEPDLFAFLKKIVQSILITIIWLGITMTAAIRGDNGFIGDEVTVGNILFYVWLLASMTFVIYLLKRVWRKNKI